jgi:hypothetical protein
MSVTAELHGRRTASRPLPKEHETRAHLEAVSTRSMRRAKPRMFYAAVTVGTLLVIVIAQLLLSIGVSQGAYQLGGLQDQQTDLQRSYQAVSEDVNRLSSPQNLAANADALGMVTNGTPVYLRLSDGAVLGSPAAASAAAGTVTGAAGNLIPNALLAGVPILGTQTDPNGSAVPPAGTKAPVPATPETNTPASGTGPVTLDGALPSPTTH